MTENELKKLFESLTIEEKAGELFQIPGKYLDVNVVNTDVGNSINNPFSKEEMYLAGSTLNVVNKQNLKAIQDEHIKNNPKHIPLLFMGDIIFGYATILPTILAQGSSFNTDLVKQACKNTAKETSLSGVNVTFSPMMDLVRDPRWGRVIESAGEDPYLNYEICKAMVEGYQGEGLDKEHTIAACVKHFAGYGAAEGGRDYDSCEITETTLRNYYLPGYKGGIDAGAKMVMTSYNTIGGIPSTINKWLLNDLLKEEWGFKGCVISDLSACTYTRIMGACETDEEIAEKCINAGVDIEMGTFTYKNLPKLVEEGKVSLETVDKAVWRILSLKNELGLFENPYRYLDLEEAKKVCYCDEHRACAKELGIQSSVLLKNDNDILPLTAKSGKVGFIGYYVENGNFYGNWIVTSTKDQQMTLKQHLEKKAPLNNFKYSLGCSILGRENAKEAERFGFCDEENRERTIAEAVELAKTLDTVVITMGELSPMSGEARSRANITIPDVQMELFNRIYEVNKNIIVILYTGRPLDIREISTKAKAILNVWLLGSEANDCISDMLLGIAAPSGHLSMTFPYSGAQIPVFYNKLHGGKHFESFYIDDVPVEPLYPFGHGLTYTKFEYGELKLDKKEIKRGEKLTASVKVKNIGQRDCYDVIQLYIRDRFADIVRPEKELKAFKKVMIPAGKSVIVSFEINDEMLKYYNSKSKLVADNGLFQVFVGNTSDIKEYKEFYLV